jgi:hypothetical protein
MKLSKGLGLAMLLFVPLTVVGCKAKESTESVKPEMKFFFNEQKIYEQNWMNWTVTDWCLTLCAAGTAIAAAVKNAFSSQNQAQVQTKAQSDALKTHTVAVNNAIAAAAAPGAPLVLPQLPVPAVQVPATSKIDKFVMFFAALTIIATTLDSKMHASQKADQYRQGDLLLQEALADYRISPKTAPDEERLLAAWHQAQRILEGAPPTLEKAKDPKTADVPQGAPGSPPPKATGTVVVNPSPTARK